MVVAVGLPENLNGFIVVLDGPFELSEAFFAVGEVGETLADFNVLPLASGMLLDDQGPA